MQHRADASAVAYRRNLVRTHRHSSPFYQRPAKQLRFSLHAILKIDEKKGRNKKGPLVDPRNSVNACQ